MNRLDGLKKVLGWCILAHILPSIFGLVSFMDPDYNKFSLGYETGWIFQIFMISVIGSVCLGVHLVIGKDHNK